MSFEQNRAKNIAQFEELEQKYENGHCTYSVNFTLRDADHEAEFYKTIQNFYGERLSWPENCTDNYPKTISVAIWSKDMVTALHIPWKRKSFEIKSLKDANVLFFSTQQQFSKRSPNVAHNRVHFGTMGRR